MALNIDEIRKEMAAPAKRAAISRAVFHQNRIKFHAQTSITADITQPVSDFLAFVKNLIPNDKFKIFKTLFRFPVKTNGVTRVCFNKLSRIFDGRNPAFSYQFRTAEARNDWNEYRRAVLREPDVWSTTGWEFFKTEINSVLVVDMPTERGNGLPSPYFYWMPIDKVVSYRTRGDGGMDWIIFKQDGGRVAVVDDATYRVFRSDKGGGLGDLLIENPHGLGYCPARFFWNEPISLREPDVKRSPLTEELDALDWYLFYCLSKRHLDLYGSYPIYSGYEQACDFTNSENGDYCDGGYLRDAQGRYRMDAAGLLMKCPKCGDKRIAGVGSFVEIPIPDGEKQPDLRNPVQMLSVDRQSLDFNVSEEDRLRDGIIASVVGQSDEVTAREALNERQVAATFESQSVVLARVKRGFEQAQRFVDETVCRLRYGDEFLSAQIDYGTDFFVYDTETLRERYKVAKESGAGEAELDALRERITATEYRNDPSQLRRMDILADIEPFRNLTRDEVLALYDKGFATAEDVRIKMDFPAYIRRFELENMSVSDFGAQTDYAKKITAIKNKLKEYAKGRIGGE